MNSLHCRYPASLFPVIALKGPPASFPVEEEFVSLQRFLHWSADIERQASTYIADHILGETYVGIHLRNGPDWVISFVYMFYIFTYGLY